MLMWIAENLATIVVSGVLLALIIVVFVIMARNKKKGKSPCGCHCGSCAMSGACHANPKRTETSK